MPAKTKKTAAKKTPQSRHYYVCSQILNSSDLPESVKDLLYKERASFRKTVPTAILDKKDLKKCREVTKKMQTIKQIGKDGEVSEIEVEFSSFDSENWRYYLKPESLEDVEDFLSLLEMEVNFSVFDPENDDDEEVSWIEEILGMPAPEEKCLVLSIQDAFLFQEGFGECDDPDCDCHLGDDEE